MCAGCGTTWPTCCKSRRRSNLSLKYLRSSSPLLAGSSCRAIGTRCAARIHALADGTMPFLTQPTVRSPSRAPCDCRVWFSTSSFDDDGSFASGRALVIHRSAACARAARSRRAESWTAAPTWPSAPSAALQRLGSGWPLHGRTSMRMLGLLRRAGPGRAPCTLIVSRVVHAARAHAERCRDQPRTGTRPRPQIRKVASCPGCYRIFEGMSSMVL